VEVVRTHGIEVAYRRVGGGPALVLAHGAMDDHRAWEPQLAALGKDFTVVAWDDPADRPHGFTLADHAGCLAAVVEDVGLGPGWVGGVSWGGTVVLELYRQRPDLVTGLILVDTYAGWRGSLPEAEVRARVAEAHAASLDLTPERAEALRAQAAVMAGADLRDVLPTIDVPTLLLWGADDPRSPLSVAEQFRAAIPHAELVVIPGAGHLSNLDRPEEFNSAIRRFCGTVA
jgi:pimeloyl-ACP methyl ester carboxylesterase